MADSLMQDLRSTSQYVKWAEKGQTITGEIIDVKRRQETVFGSGEPAEWPNGDPKLQAVFVLQTDERDPDLDDDNGQRNLVVNLYTGQRRALIAGCKAAGIEEPTIGMRMTAAWEDGAGTAASPRLFRYEFAPGKGPLAGIASSEPKTKGKAASNDDDSAEKIRKLIAAGLTADEIAATLGVAKSVVLEVGGVN